MSAKLKLKAAFISLLMLAIFLGAWQLATQPKESVVQAGADSEYAAMMGKGKGGTSRPTTPRPTMMGKGSPSPTSMMGKGKRRYEV